MSNKVILKRSSVSGKVPDSESLDYGELALNYTDGRLFYKDSTDVVRNLVAGGVNNQSIYRHTYVANVGEDTFLVEYTSPNVDVFVNGIKLKPSEYDATSGVNVILATPAEQDDVIDLIGFVNVAFTDFSVSGSGISFDETSVTVSLASATAATPNTLVYRDSNGDIAVSDISASSATITDLTVAGHIIPDTNIAYDLGSATNRFRDIYLSGNTIVLGDATISSDGNGSIVLPEDTKLGDAQLPPVNLNIAPEVLEIQVAAPEAGDDTRWFWTWLQSTLPYARATITNSPQLTVPLYKKGAYVINNYAANEIFDQMTQTHHATLKWVDGAGHDNDVQGWVTYQDNVSTSHPDINGGNPTLVQRITVNVPEVVTPPTLTLPVGIGYDVSFSTPGAYTFGANMGSGSDMSSAAEGDNPTLGPLYRGATYTFHLDSSLSGHPFYITTDNGQGFVVGQYVGEYTSGVVGSRNNGSTGQETLTFTVPLDAPDNLYYQCAYHGSMRGVMTIKDLAVEVNNNGNYVLYFQHGHEGHKTPIEIRPIPSLVNQMCLVYDQSTNTFVPQDLATYVENTPSFKNKIQEVAGTATLVAPDGTSLVATVKIFSDASYLPFSGNVAGDIAYTQDNNTMFIWDEVQYNWISTKAKSTTEIAEGTNLYFTNDRVGAYLSNNGFDTAANIVASIVDTAPATLDTLNELAAALGDDPNYATTVTTALGTKLNSADFDSTFDTRLATKSTDDIAEGSNLYYTDARAQAAITVNSTLSKTGGQISLPSSGVTAATYGSASAVPVFTVDAYGRITSATTTNVAGVSGFSYTAATNTYTITTSAGTTFDASGDLSSFDTADLAEGTNLYFTTSRARDSVSFTAGSGGYDATTGVITIPTNTDQLTNGAGFATTSYVDTVVAGKDNTDEITEGTTNLYFTTARARASISASGSLSYDSSTGELSFTLPPLDTDTVTEATNLYFTTARARESISATGSLSYDSATGIISFTQGDTDTVSEGVSNLYFTTARARESISATGSLSYDSATGIISFTQGDTDTVSEGSSNLYFTTARARESISASGSLSYDSLTGILSYVQGSTDTVAEGSSNLYYTTARANTDFDTRLATKSTSDIAEGTNLYWTTARGESMFDTRLATKSTSDLAEGTNLYFTTARAQDAISTSGELLTYGSGVVGLTVEAIQDVIGAMVSSNTESAISVTYNDAGNVLDFAVDTATIATRTYVDNAIATVIDSAPAALDTLNELAAAINDDANYAATVTTALSNKADKSVIVTAGTGLTGGGTLANNFTIAHADTSSQVSVDNSGNTFIQDITLDGFGHITGIASGTVSIGDGAMTVTAGTDLSGGGQVGTANQSGSSSVTVNHANITRSDSTSSASPARNGSFTVVDSVTTNARGHVTAVNVKTVTLPDFEIVSVSKSLTLSTSWQDTGISSSDLSTGSYMIQIESVSDYTVGGGQYSEYYTGVMSWFAGSTNSTYVDEITLHRAGHAPNTGIIFLRTQRNSTGVLKLQIAGNTTNSAAYTYNFKFRRMI